MALVNIAVAEINREVAVQKFLSREYLQKTAKLPNYPLQRIIAWFKNEDAMTFSLSNMTIGKDKDDFAILYYFESKRWKIGKDGYAFVSSADADNMMEKEEEDLQLLIDTILNDEIEKVLRATLKNTHSIRAGKSKHAGEQESLYNVTLLGIQG